MRKMPAIMGVLNVTPDSFSDGGKYLEPEAAFQRARAMVDEGASIIDVGGESTRPGANEVSTQEELDRVLPVVEMLCARLPVRVSCDTKKYAVAEAAVRAGATIINDISGGADFRIASLVKSAGTTIVLMHMQGSPETMQKAPSYPEGVISEVKRFLVAQVRKFQELGIDKSRIWVDPGIGFGKTLEHNLALLNALAQFNGIGGELLIGTSRKSFLSRIFGNKTLTVEERLPGTIATNIWAWEKGASVFRVHDVREVHRAFKTWEALKL